MRKNYKVQRRTSQFSNVQLSRGCSTANFSKALQMLAIYSFVQHLTQVQRPIWRPFRLGVQQTTPVEEHKGLFYSAVLF
jgi:hypothetical protein